MATKTLSPEDAAAIVRRFRLEPSVFLTDALGVQTAYPKQIEVMESVRDNRRTSVVGANSSGKDWLSGRIILWWLTIWDDGVVVVIGPTARQVEEIVWREARTAYQGARIAPGGRMYDSAKYEVSTQRYALGFSTDKEYKLTGFHSGHLLLIVTEAHGVPQTHIEAAKMLNPYRILLTGNALSLSGEFYEAHNGRESSYKAIKISAYDTPNLIEGRLVVPGMVTAEDIAEKKRDWGETSPEYRASVLAEFTIGGGRNYFDMASVLAMDADVREPMSELRGGAVKVWKPPVVGGRYVAGADCAWGERGAYDCMTVIDYQTGEKVAEVYGRLPDDEMAQECVNLLTQYNKAYLGVERNSEGRHVVDKIIALGYGDRMYHTHEDWKEVEKHRGWLTDATTRPVMLRELEEAVRARRIVEHCKHGLDEFKSFVRDEKNRPGPVEGHYADHVMSWAIAWQMRKHARFSQSLRGTGLLMAQGAY